MRIAEIFYSIQGEGALTGVPSVFIRTSGCNLRCTWCDTRYASWEPEGRNWAIGEILDEIGKFPANHVVLTGGEPMVAKGIHDLAAKLRAAGRHITIETAGTIEPGEIACDLASLSPKLAHSTPAESEIGADWRLRHENLRLQPEILKSWIGAYDFQLKFVTTGTDLGEIDALLEKLGKIPPHRVLLMPEGTDAEMLREREDEIVELCKQRGFRFCPRLHIALFGNTRGT